MSPIAIGLSGIAAILVLISLRTPIGLALGSVAFVGIAMITDWNVAFSMLGLIPYETASSWELSAIPMFLLMGSIAYHSGLTESLFAAARVWLGSLPGGLAVATNFACAGFAAASGSSLATTVAMGRIAIPEMKRYGYHPGLSTGVVASAGTLGSLIPPSVLMILIGVFSQTSIVALFIAGVVPGVLTALVFAAMIVVRCRLNPKLAPVELTKATLAERMEALKHVWPLPLLVLGVIGGIYGGVVTATEAGAFGAVLAFIFGAIKGQMSGKALLASVLEALKGTASIFFVVLGAVLLTRFMALSGVPVFLSDLMAAAGASPTAVILMAFAIYVVLGMFLDPLGLLLLTLPIMLPIFEAARLDMIWVGILLVKFVEIGLMTPPVGLNVYAVKSLVGAEVPIEAIFKGVLWFVAVDVALTLALIAFPEIILFLPRLLIN